MDSSNAFWIILQRLRTPLIVLIVSYAIAIAGMVIIPGADNNGNPYHLTFLMLSTLSLILHQLLDLERLLTTLPILNVYGLWLLSI